MVTGGFGFIGSHLVEKLLDMGEEVVVLSHPKPPENNYRYIIRNPNSHRMNVVYSDMKNLDSMVSILETFKVDLVYHLAAIASHRLSVKDPYTYLENNYTSLLNLLEAARVVEPSPKIVFTSSSSIYGDHEPPLREDLEPRPRGPYALSKFFGERLCKLYVELYGLDCSIIRYFNVVGERCRGNIVFKIFAEKISVGEPLEVYGRWINREFKPAERDFTYVSDAVEGTIAVGIKAGRGEVFNIGFGRPVSILKVTELMMEAFGKRVKMTFIELQPHESLVSYCDNSKARSILGWVPKTDIEEMVKHYVDWFISSR
ncbi:MAG: GDP-mannose 4,6-dehydratase [Nitrososphaeria archaeon]|nr:GDP-mannose 4,6-dehydratase [Nitrososphaeria archaeon]